jgi:ABC-2 type transport system permease protein
MISVIILYINNGFIGNIPSILLLIFLGSTAFTGLGLLIASYANNYSSASLMTTIAMMPLLLLALLADISKEMAVVSKFSPGTYMLEGIEKAMFNGAGIGDIGTELMVLVVFNVIVYAVTVRVIGNEKRS